MGFDTSSFESVLDINYGIDPELDALLLHFMTENHLEYSIDPSKNASREQIRFMVALDNNEFYAPCSDWMFLQLLKPGLPKELLREYILQWRVFVRLAREYCPDRYLRRRFVALCRHKFRMALASPIVLPSRLMKRMITILMTQSGIDDPYRPQRKALNEKAGEVVGGKAFDSMINACPEAHAACVRIDDLRFNIDMVEVERLMRLSTMTDLWRAEEFCEEKLRSCGLDEEMQAGKGEFAAVAEALGARSDGPLRILLLPKRSGGLMFDIRLVRALLRMGHKVILALKEGFYFDHPTVWDRDGDPVLDEALRGAYFADNDRLSKNELLSIMRENSFVVISDGTRERFNPYRTSVTFARAWKECDLVLAKGEGKFRRFVESSHRFTRDIVSYFRDDSGRFHLHYKPKAERVTKFSEGYIREKAEAIISEMRQARNKGKAVIFYSGIVGSVPGQTEMAIKIMTTHVKHLRTKLENVYIINPAEHFEEGMDADDLMFMWEMVQRSGYINIWRFQSHSDIEEAFGLMDMKVPPVWAGKDSTYSTGCTKEMHIALDVQRKQPELQIIGPSPDKFFRRKEYGVGRFCDVAIDTCN
ncbi:ARMT1-like domain-containing protein [Salidesulfovibrio onnuriiensis]|uniref:ARMT1-like domain-containing protein n=1 Tax=Salidesulfovibrio onnuriiensis TaxID=2583823 RepID=UPI0011C8D494|nr:ARMT1-like domain-containing protein [Salidesulfovibrio onnuriiensis]